MAKFDLRILLETVEGQKTSFISQSFVDTNNDLVLSASQVYGRITGSISCSYQNANKFSGSDFNTSLTFKDNVLLSASLSGSENTGSIVFTATDTEYDRLLRYKFFGEKVCNVLGLPVGQWIYVDKVRLAPDDEANIFQGNINVENAFIGDTLTFASNANINSDVPFLIDTGSDRYIKFIDTRGTGNASLIFGYDKDNDLYEINAADDTVFNISNVNSLTAGTITASIYHQELTVGETQLNTLLAGQTTVSGSLSDEPLLKVQGNMSSSGEITSSKLLVTGTSQFDGDVTVGGSITAEEFITQIITTAEGSNIFGNSVDDVQTFTGSLRVSGSGPHYFQAGRVGIGTTAPTKALTVEGDISASGQIKGAHFHSSGNDTNVGNLRIGRIDGGGTLTPAQISHVGNTDNVIKLHANKDLIEFETSQFLVEAPITSSNDISSSGTLISSEINTIGNITASGNISSSGTIIGSNLSGTNTGDVSLAGSLDYITISGQTITRNTIDIDLDTNLSVSDTTGQTGIDMTFSNDDISAVASNLSTTSDVKFNHITASGNISSSGTIISNVITPTTITNVNTTNITASGNISGSSTSTGSFGLILGDGSQLSGISSPFTAASITGSAQGLLSQSLGAVQNITASGDISSSGTITGNAINVNGTNVLVADGVDISADTNLAGGTGITLTGDTLSTTDSEIVHDNLSGFVANEHIDHSGVEITAGAGLTGGGDITSTRDIAVGAGTGVTVNANDVAIGQDVATTANVQFNNITSSGNISASGTLHTFGGRLNIKSAADNTTAFNISDVDNQNNLNFAIDTNQHSDLHIERDGVDKIRFNTFHPAQIDNDAYESRGGLILGSDADRGDKTGFGLYVSAGPDSGSIYTKERVFIGVGGATGSNDMLSVGGNITTTSHITASGNISASGEVAGATLDINGDGNFEGNITASGNISASGDIFVGGDISASDGTRALHYDVSVHALKSSGTTLDINGTDISFNTDDLFIDQSNSRVGIGDTSPDEKLHVVGNIKLEDAGTTNYIDFTEGDDERARISIDNSTTPGAFKIQTHDASSGYQDRIVVKHQQAATQVSIGTDTPATNMELTVEGDISASGTVFADAFQSVTGGSIIDFNDDVDISGNLTASNGTFTGNVGIGTSNPTYELDVAGDIGVNQFIHHNDDDNTAINFTTDQIQLQTAGTTGFTLDSSQRIGIGINSPSEKLDVDGNIKARDKIVSETFSDGIAGTGFRIETGSNGSLFTVDNLTIRKQLNAFELLIHQVRATNGSLFISNTGKVLSASLSSVANHYSMSFETGSGLGHSFVVGDLIRAQRAVPSTNGSGSITFISDLHVVSVNNTGSLVGALSGSHGTDDPRPGYEYVRIGNLTEEDRQGIIYMTADDGNAPFIEVATNITSHSHFNTSDKSTVRMGKLDGITTANSAFGTLSGFGFYASGSAFLEGGINATNGKIGGFTIDATSISASNLFMKSSGEITGSDVLFDGGKIGGFTLGANKLSSNNLVLSSSITSTDEIISASNFNVKANGQVTASNISMSGVVVTSDITADGGTIGGFDIDGIGISDTSKTLVLSSSGQITGSNVLFDGGVIGGFEIGSNIISSSTGTLILKDNGQITGSAVSMSGTITADSGEIGGFTIGDSEINSGNFILNATNETLQLGQVSDFLDSGTKKGLFVSSSGQLFVGQKGNQFIKFDGTDVEIKSQKATLSGSSVEILTPNFFLGSGTNNISSSNNDLSITTKDLTASGSNIEILSPNVFLGKGNSNFISASGGELEISSSNFHLKDGNITASNVDLSGKITATSGLFSGDVSAASIQATTGSIGGFILSTNKLSSDNLILSSSTTAGDLIISTSKFQVDGAGGLTASAADINGKITTSDINADGGLIGGFTLSTNKLSSDNLVLSSSTGTSEVISASKFNVKANGQVTASNIKADGGTISSFQIQNTKILSTGSNGQNNGLELHSTDGIFGHGDSNTKDLLSHAGMFKFSEDTISAPAGSNGNSYDLSNNEILTFSGPKGTGLVPQDQAGGTD